MKAYIKYIIFCPNNYQGGSGSYFEHSTMLDLDPDLEFRDLHELIDDKIRPIMVENSHNWQGGSYSIKHIEVLL